MGPNYSISSACGQENYHVAGSSFLTCLLALLSECLVKFVEETVRHEHASSPKKPIYLVGDSLGGCLALAVAAHNPKIDLVVILSNPATSFGRSLLQPLIPVLEAWLEGLSNAVPLLLSCIIAVDSLYRLAFGSVLLLLFTGEGLGKRVILLWLSFTSEGKKVMMTSSDRLSELPKNIIEKILMKLPQKDAIRTSILSSKWRYKWLSLPQLVFDYPFNYNFSPAEITNLITIVYQALLLHHGPLINFTFSVSDFDDFSSHINHWLHFLSTIDIQHFSLRIWRGNPHKLPSQFYSFQQLKHLNLFNCVFKPPASFRGFEKLVSLEFHNVVFAAERFGIFISNCPLLESLILEGCPHFFCLRISSPNLKFLCFNGTFDSVNLKNSPLLQVVSIALNGMAEISKYFKDRKTSNLVEVASSIPAIQDLSIHLHFLKFLAKGGVQNRLPKSLDQLRNLYISDLCFEKIEEVSCAVCLIRSSPNLEKLTITAHTDTTADMEGAVEHLRSQDFSGCSLNKLKTVKMEEIGGVEPELELMKFLLANSSKLEKFEILPIKDESTGRGFHILKELIRFRRASAKAEIIYSDDSI